jgi:hypothetical protein
MQTFNFPRSTVGFNPRESALIRGRILGCSPCLRASVVGVAFPIPAMSRGSRRARWGGGALGCGLSDQCHQCSSVVRFCLSSMFLRVLCGKGFALPITRDPGAYFPSIASHTFLVSTFCVYFTIFPSLKFHMCANTASITPPDFLYVPRYLPVTTIVSPAS